ncbi:Hypothetical protein Bdt_1681 [Bdellovibrio bacteriovorus str. Tiberius]|uniref:Uncharacterized protein n=1 Tax=Bdellovibrio bacteriovorus str. Tiberius TaxID=1069642 RepID=K7YNI9_BDEBC|nr:Hypothetical protein Bdt_1681 [Bdellovibrio bacteriovorus str. Tiberius]
MDNHGLSLDIKIILLTAWKVFRREGVAAKNSETMTPFAEAAKTNTKKTDLT